MKFRPWTWIVYYGLVLSFPVWYYGFPFPTHDGDIHETWYANFAGQLWAGELFPRWLHQMNAGLGSPVFFFYPPVPYYLTSLFHPFFPGAFYTWHELGLASALGLLASGLGAFFWLRRMASERTAAIVAILYMSMPYHLAVDLHTRGAFAEFWTFVWMPLILLCVLKLAAGERFAFLGLALSYALLVMTHLPTTLIFSAVVAGYTLVVAPAETRVRVLAGAAGAVALGVGVASIYLLPAMTTQANVSMDVMRTGHSYFENGYFFPHYENRLARDDFEYGLFWMVATMLGIAVCCLHLTRRFSPDVRVRREGLFWFAMAACSVFMMVPISKPLYLLFPPLKLIQFPWRFNAVLAVSVAAMLALAMPGLGKPFTVFKTAVALVGALLVGLWIPQSFKLIVQSTLAEKPTGQVFGTSRKQHNWCTAEYRPRWARQDALVSLDKFGKSGAQQNRVRVAQGNARIEVKEWKPRNIVLGITSATNSIVEVAQYFYPGWTARTAAKGTLSVSPSDPAGLVSLAVPQGTHTIELRLEQAWPERMGWLISLCSFITLAGWAFLSSRRSRLARVS